MNEAGVLYDGADAATIAHLTESPRVVLLDETTSTMDVAHALASEGAPDGLLVLAHSQTAGRGRSGAQWFGVPGASVLCTVVVRPGAFGAAQTPPPISLRVGLRVASILDDFANTTVMVKWPNDLMLHGAKVAGILIEARWRDAVPEWMTVAIGLNVNAAPGTITTAGYLGAHVPRLDVLARIVPAMRDAARHTGALTPEELSGLAARDFLAGRRMTAPLRGVGAGVLAGGELVVETERGRECVVAGSIVLEER